MRLLPTVLLPVGAAMALTAITPAAPRAFDGVAQAQETTSKEAFTWSGVVPAGRWIRVWDLNGAVSVEPTSGDKVQVTAVERWRRGDTSMVRFVMQKVGPGGDDVLICALWGDRSDCDEHGYHSHEDSDDRRGGRNNDVNVQFRVLVPRGVRVAMNTVNGSVHVTGATAEVRAGTINGEVDVATSGGPVNASSVNGSVRASIGQVNPGDEMSFSTVNGSLITQWPADLSADVDLTTLNGSLRSDYEMSLSGRIETRRVNAHIGKPGGARIRLRTVNGSVELRKGG